MNELDWLLILCMLLVGIVCYLQGVTDGKRIARHIQERDGDDDLWK